ncbi:MAG: DUF1415 domain-containing protein [Saprospiraceae bacterium]
MNYQKITADWLEHFVIGLNLCPFAKKPFATDKIIYRVEETTEVDKLMETLLTELLILNNTPATEISTTLIIHPNVLTDFLDYNDFLHIANDILKRVDMEGIIQIASFHPDYRFAETQENDVTNYTNRSPFPMLHLLRESEVEQAVETYPEVEKIPVRNMEQLESLGMKGWEKVSKKWKQNT